MARASNAGQKSRSFGDPGAWIGLAAAIAVIGTAIVLGGRPLAFFDVPSILIVVGGTLAVTLTSFSLRDFARAPAVLSQALSTRAPVTPQQVGSTCIQVAILARREGALAIEHEASRLSAMIILRRGLMLLSDGIDSAIVLTALRQEIAQLQTNMLATQSLLRRGAEVAPAMGLIGTLVGLVQMLGQLDEPSKIGPSMAVALLTTLYGAVIAHAMLMPLAERLAGRAQNERLLHELQFCCLQSLVENENPRVLETRLNGLLPDSAQLAMFD